MHKHNYHISASAIMRDGEISSFKKKLHSIKGIQNVKLFVSQYGEN